MLDFFHKLENKDNHYNIFKSAAIFCSAISTALQLTDVYYDISFTFCDLLKNSVNNVVCRPLFNL